MKAVGQFYVVRKEVEDFPVNNSCTTDSHSDSTDAWGSASVHRCRSFCSLSVSIRRQAADSLSANWCTPWKAGGDNFTGFLSQSFCHLASALSCTPTLSLRILFSMSLCGSTMDSATARPLISSLYSRRKQMPGQSYNSDLKKKKLGHWVKSKKKKNWIKWFIMSCVHQQQHNKVFASNNIFYTVMTKSWTPTHPCSWTTFQGCPLHTQS